jgi:hypothetical protein
MGIKILPLHFLLMCDKVTTLNLIIRLLYFVSYKIICICEKVMQQ